MKPPWTPVRRVLLELLREAGVDGTLSVVFVGDAEIARLHEEFFGDDRPTDVISFPLADAASEDGEDGEPAPLGEVIVSVDTARREAERRGLPLAREVALYAIHGTLHILGLDDIDPRERRVMKREERRWIARFRALGGA